MANSSSLHQVANLHFTDLFGFGPLKTSAGFNWANLFAMIAQNPIASTPALSVPAIEENQLIIHLERPIQISGKVGSSSFASVSRPGTFCIASRGTPTTWQISGDRALVLVLCLRHEGITRLAVEALDAGTRSIEVVDRLVVEDGLIYQLGRAIAQELNEPGLAGGLWIESIYQVLLIHLFRNYVVFTRTAPNVKGHLPLPVLRNALDFIHTNIQADLSLSDISQAAHLSAFHFSRQFKNSMGMTVFQYVLQKRLEMGRDLLISGKFSVTEAANLAGFGSASHFSRQFKRQYGFSPEKMIHKSNQVNLVSNIDQLNLE